MYKQVRAIQLSNRMIGVRKAMTAAVWRLRCHWAAISANRHNKIVLSTNPLRRLLVVCYGNINRSPLAAALLADSLAGICVVRSAGFHQADGRSPSAMTVAFGSTLDVNLSIHQSSVVSPADLAWADTIVLMDRHNWHSLRKFGVDPGKLLWLGAFDGGGELPDPYGKPDAEAAQALSRVHACATMLAKKIFARRSLTSSHFC